MKNINNITSNIILDNNKNFYDWKFNWLNSPNKELNLYSIFQDLFTNNKYIIYIGIINKEHIFYSFIIINSIFISVGYVTSKDLKSMLTNYNKINDKNIFNIFVEGIKNENY